jgi:hypothetical protein
MESEAVLSLDEANKILLRVLQFTVLKHTVGLV